jgi:hypothetical protein
MTDDSLLRQRRSKEESKMLSTPLFAAIILRTGRYFFCATFFFAFATGFPATGAFFR